MEGTTTRPRTRALWVEDLWGTGHTNEDREVEPDESETDESKTDQRNTDPKHNVAD